VGTCCVVQAMAMGSTDGGRCSSSLGCSLCALFVAGLIPGLSPKALPRVHLRHVCSSTVLS